MHSINVDKTIPKSMKEKIEFMVALIAEFAKKYQLTDAQAAQYMSRWGAIELCEKHYDIMHTLTWDDNIESIAIYCRRQGGNL